MLPPHFRIPLFNWLYRYILHGLFEDSEFDLLHGSDFYLSLIFSSINAIQIDHPNGWGELLGPQTSELQQCWVCNAPDAQLTQLARVSIISL